MSAHGKDALASALITTAGADETRPAGTSRRALSKELARRLRSAKNDDEAAEVLEAVVELARSED